MQLRRARVTPAIWVSVHDPLRRIIACLVARFHFVSPNEMVHVTTRRVWRWVDGLLWGQKRQRTAPSFPLFDRSTFIFPTTCSCQTTTSTRSFLTDYKQETRHRKRTCMTWS